MVIKTMMTDCQSYETLTEGDITWSYTSHLTCLELAHVAARIMSGYFSAFW